MLIDEETENEGLQKSKSDELLNRRKLRYEYEKAALALSGGAVSYTLDTGQSRQSVTRADLASIMSMLRFLDETISALEYELGLRHSQPKRIVPGW